MNFSFDWSLGSLREAIESFFIVDSLGNNLVDELGNFIVS